MSYLRISTCRALKHLQVGSCKTPRYLECVANDLAQNQPEYLASPTAAFDLSDKIYILSQYLFHESKP